MYSTYITCLHLFTHETCSVGVTFDICKRQWASAGMVAVTRVSVPVGGESTRELQDCWLYTMSAQRVWKKDIRRQSREINVSGLNSNLLMLSMATIWRRGELWRWEGGKNSCLFLNSVMERLTVLYMLHMLNTIRIACTEALARVPYFTLSCIVWNETHRHLSLSCLRDVYCYGIISRLVFWISS